MATIRDEGEGGRVEVGTSRVNRGRNAVQVRRRRRKTKVLLVIRLWLGTTWRLW